MEYTYVGSYRGVSIYQHCDTEKYIISLEYFEDQKFELLIDCQDVIDDYFN